MRQKHFLYSAAVLFLSSCMLLPSCSDDDNTVPTPPDKESSNEDKRVTTDEIYFANHFAKNTLNLYYYWNIKIAGDLKKLDENKNTDPIKTVDEIKYHEGDTEVDKWTMLIDDMKKFESGVSGVSTTFGYQLIPYLMSENSDEVVAAIGFVYKGSPAEKAGLKRGDIIYKLDGKAITRESLNKLYSEGSINFSIAKAEFKGNNVLLVPSKENITLNAIEMYEDPVLLDSIYEFNGKKVGYLAYSSFDLKSIPKLIEVSKKFKAEGINEMILDLRYNGGGYVFTENVMASMYAPEAAVAQKKTFEKEDYNNNLTKVFIQNGQSTVTKFSTTHTMYNENHELVASYDTKTANIGVGKIYGLVTNYSASASEALLGGLMPYMDIELVGVPTHGKYCTGWMLTPEDVYKKAPEVINNWGMYVMVSIYQNAKGETPCMPNGMQPDIKVRDNPLMATQLGDTNEVMLKAALQSAGKVYKESGNGSRAAALDLLKPIEGPHKANFGKRILLPSQLPLLIE